MSVTDLVHALRTADLAFVLRAAAILLVIYAAPRVVWLYWRNSKLRARRNQNAYTGRHSAAKLARRTEPIRTSSGSSRTATARIVSEPTVIVAAAAAAPTAPVLAPSATSTSAPAPWQNTMPEYAMRHVTRPQTARAANRPSAAAPTIDQPVATTPSSTRPRQSSSIPPAGYVPMSTQRANYGTEELTAHDLAKMLRTEFDHQAQLALGDKNRVTIVVAPNGAASFASVASNLLERINRANGVSHNPKPETSKNPTQYLVIVLERDRTSGQPNIVGALKFSISSPPSMASSYQSHILTIHAFGVMPSHISRPTPYAALLMGKAFQHAIQHRIRTITIGASLLDGQALSQVQSRLRNPFFYYGEIINMQYMGDYVCPLDEWLNDLRNSMSADDRAVYEHMIPERELAYA